MHSKAFKIERFSIDKKIISINFHRSKPKAYSINISEIVSWAVCRYLDRENCWKNSNGLIHVKSAKWPLKKMIANKYELYQFSVKDCLVLASLHVTDTWKLKNNCIRSYFKSILSHGLSLKIGFLFTCTQ